MRHSSVSSSRLAFVSYEFSERIIGGSIRSIGFARNLPAFGWDPYVITASDPSEQPVLGSGNVRYVPSRERQMPGGIAIDHGDSVLRDPRGLLGILSPLKRLLPLERQLLWIPAFRRSLIDDQVQDVDVVLSTVAPYTSLASGHWLARRLKVPHVVDLRDDWKDRFRIENRTWINKWLLDRFVLAVLRSAAAVLVVSPVTFSRLQTLGVNVHLVYNGYDERDYADVPMDSLMDPPTIGGDTPVTVLHSGWLGEFRSIRPVLEAMESVASVYDPSGGVVFRFCQMGLVDEEALQHLSCKYRGVEIDIVGQQSHGDARKAMAAADVLLVIPGTLIPAAVSGKLFEYARSRRPTLLVAGEGAARVVADDIGMRFVADPHSRESLTQNLSEIVIAKRENRLRTHVRPDKIRMFSRETSSQQLAIILDSVANKKTNGLGSVE